ncbi:MAG: hypothetical protein M3Y72_06075 [Acidobacteriota bacterium]|nr:hypothetical protein [Acidobacteriota bacterium]MDQ2840596.1 hypothetical protein [Acidobacteriota bacterium]
MFNSPILEVAIGMIFFYLLLSLICSALNEIIEAGLQNRANDLEHGIRRLLDDPDPAGWSFFRNAANKIAKLFRRITGREKQALALVRPKTDGLASRLYRHAFIQGLYKDPHNLPSYIPARNFALALLDIVAPGQHGTAGTTRATASQPNTLIINGNAPPPALPTPPLTNLRSALADPNNVRSERVRDALIALIDAADDDPVRVRENIEGWFNNTTDRIAGWYKRRTQIIILILGMSLAIVLNADTVLVLNTLWHNSALRSSLASQAEQYAQEIRVEQKGNTSVDQERVRKVQSELASLGLPIGWDGQDDAHRAPIFTLAQPGNTFWSSMHQCGLHWLGWLLTSLAISLGAPFWFDLLNKFIVVRSTVKPKEKSQEDQSKD